MKIVLATGIFPPDIGGPATYTERLVEELFRRGAEEKLFEEHSIIFCQGGRENNCAQSVCQKDGARMGSAGK